MNKTKRSWLKFRTLRALTKRFQRRRARARPKHQQAAARTFPRPTRELFRQNAFNKPMTFFDKR